MTRDEIVKRLQVMLRVAYDESPSAESLREAIALLTPPSDPKLAWLRHWVDNIPPAIKMLENGTAWDLRQGLNQAVDALAREKELVAKSERTQQWLDNFTSATAQATVETMDLTRRLAAQEALIAEKGAEIEHLTAEVSRLLEQQERQGRALQEAEEWLLSAVAEDKQTWAFLSCWLHLVDAFTGETDESLTEETAQ